MAVGVGGGGSCAMRSRRCRWRRLWRGDFVGVVVGSLGVAIRGNIGAHDLGLMDARGRNGGISDRLPVEPLEPVDRPWPKLANEPMP